MVTAFKEDRAIIEAQQQALNSAPDFKPLASVHDKALVMARGILRDQLALEQS